MNTKNITLYFKDAKSNKQYNASLEKSGKLFIVNFAYGKRGGNLKKGTKTKAPVTYEKALAIYEKLVKSKIDKGYSEKKSKKVKPAKKTGDLSFEQIKKVSRLLLSTEDVNSKIALSILENQAFPKILLTEIFCLYMMTLNEDLKAKAFDILDEHGSDSLKKMMNRELSLGGEGSRHTTEKKVMKNIKIYVENNELDGVKLAKALYSKYGTGVTYLLQATPKDQQIEVFRTFLKGTKLKLNGKTLTRFPPAIFEFPELTEIDLSDNKIGSLPTRINVFKNLKVLNLGKNNIKSINKKIGQLAKLKELYLNDNILGDGPPSVIFELLELQKLDLTNCKEQSDIHELPENIIQLKKLKEFKLDHYRRSVRSNDSYSNYPQIKKVTGNPIDMKPLAIAEAAFDQGDLSPVSYIFEYGDKKLIKKVLDHFYDVKTQSFDFSENFLAMLPDEISAYKVRILNLTKTYFGSSSLPPEELAKIHHKRTEIIAKLKNLEALILDDCYLNRIANLSGLTKLKKLSIKASPGVNELFDLSPLQELEDLNLNFIRLEEFPKELFSLKKLQRLRLKGILGNDVKTPTAKDLTGLKNLKQLNTLHLRIDSAKKISKAEYKTILTYLPEGCVFTID